jgi:hypothetical protein
MCAVPALLCAWLLAQAAAPAAPPAAEGAPPPEATPPPAPEVPPSTVEQPPPELAPPPPLPAPAPAPRVYGYAGMSEASLGLGYSSVSGFVAGGGLRRFVVAGVAPGLEGRFQTGKGTTSGLLLAGIRLAPVRLAQIALVVTPKAGRVFISSHDDGWAAGGDAGVIWFAAPNVGLEIGYEVLWLLPRSFCGDLTSCTLQTPVLGLRLSF